MAIQPSQEHIQAFQDITGMGPDELHIVQAALRHYLQTNNNADPADPITPAIDEYFNLGEHGFKKKYGWDPDAFSTDPDGGASAGGGQSYHIESLPELRPNDEIKLSQGSRLMTAPSRPPSRTNNRTPANIPIPENVPENWEAVTETNPPWAAAASSSAPWAGNWDVPVTKEEEERQIARAIQESTAAQNPGRSVHWPDQGHQETGVDEQMQGVQFGPATKSAYDPAQWGMVLSSQTVGVPPSLRKRDQGQPGFVAQTKDYNNTHRLGGLLTILHAIPLARNAILKCGPDGPNYGTNPRWWDGESIDPDRSWDDERAEDIPKEAHRLMAFLDDSERSYASIESLSAKLSWGGGNSVEAHFYGELSRWYPEAAASLVSEATRVDPESGQTGETKDFGITHIKDLPDDARLTLEAAWDHQLWIEAFLDTESDLETPLYGHILSGVADVIAMEIQLQPGESMAIQMTWCPERYLGSRKEEARALIKHWRWIKATSQDLEEKEQSFLQWHNDRTRTDHNIGKISGAAIEELKRHIALIQSKARFRTFQASGFDESTYPTMSAIPCELSPDESAQIRRLERKINSCERLIDHAATIQEWLTHEREVVDKVGKLVAQRLTDPALPRQKPFTAPVLHLRGVATKPNTVYVCKRRPSSLIELEDTVEPADQWWRLELDVARTEKPVIVERVEAERVLRDMWQESSECLLVYATDKAINTEPLPLSQPLRQFVLSDNKTFRQELSRPPATLGEGQERAEYWGGALSSPGKRKHPKSVDSMDSNRGVLGDSDAESDPGLGGIGHRFIGARSLGNIHDNGSTINLNATAYGDDQDDIDPTTFELMDIDNSSSSNNNTQASTIEMGPPSRRPTMTVVDNGGGAAERESPILGRPLSECSTVHEAERSGTAAESSRTITPEPLDAPLEEESAAPPEMSEREGRIPFVAIQASTTSQEKVPRAVEQDTQESLTSLIDLDIPEPPAPVESS